MGENNEYYADKMRRLLENRDRQQRIGLQNPAGVHESEPGEELDEELQEQEDFSFESTRRPEKKKRPRSFEEKYQQVREAEAEARASGKKRKYSLRDIIVSCVLVCGILILGAFCVYKIFFVISSISVEGNELYTDEQILASAGIEVGANIYSFSSRIAEENIQMYCPEVDYIKVKRTPPGKIVVTVVEENAYFYVDIHGELRALTADLRVLGGVSEEEADELIELRLPTVGRAVAGEKIVFRNGELDYTFEVSKAVSESSLCDRIDKLDLTDQHNVRMVCDGKYLLKLAEYTDSAAKLKIADKILENEMFDNSNKASIDLSELSETGVIVDNQLDLDW
ncbi:MAG: FtsQ-type POTRA domain-containing protein [Clostridia bacterium]|nr:FtsQ-type POTRA domain-containing protein [Clostridia bacterium]MBQ8474070.1 FtsQ-type POTRA domain-containing protein [Clostridia bacterium]